jgi:phosphate transport system substrate-binding protein
MMAHAALPALRLLCFAISGLAPLSLLSCGLQTRVAPQSAYQREPLQLRGSTSSFAAPAYWRWFNGLAVREEINADLSVMSSGESIRSFIAGKVDFAGTDSAPTSAEMAQVRRGILAFPVTAGAIAIAYNLPGCKLRLTRQQLAKVFLGQIRNFVQLGCSSMPIVLLHRNDPSGSTANITATLASFSPQWKEGPGVGRLVRWPEGEGVRGSEGMAQYLLATPGSIGYIEAAYVRSPLQAAALENSSGDFHAPTAASAASSLLEIKLNQNLLGANPSPSRGYPIVSLNWMLVPRRGLNQRAEAVRTSLRYILSQAGQDDAELLGYVPMPVDLRERALRKLSEIQH